MRYPTDTVSKHSNDSQPAIFLDRDGVLISNVYREDKTLGSVRNPNEVIFNESATAAINLAIAYNFEVFVVSNQPDIERKLIDPNDFIQIDKLMRRRFRAILETSYCPHSGEYECECRKPKPGMIFALAAKFNINLGNSWMIGDRISDMQAGRNAGVNIACVPPLVGGVLAERTCKFRETHSEASNLMSAIEIAITRVDQPTL
jgi:D-glycero-D-manno-heptose 1,7-bisphosphate phosphatase